VITSDNPRTENPSLIIDDIISGIGKNDFDKKDIRIVPERRLAIKEAVGMAGKGDLVLIAGKGHETYQIVGTKKSHFDDREEARLAIKERNER
jgi:UDP-N-acetylmuramoyl-L-alanyl-D-glutamate--2,6-diaminopimelate ligase